MSRNCTWICCLQIATILFIHSCVNEMWCNFFEGHCFARVLGISSFNRHTSTREHDTQQYSADEEHDLWVYNHDEKKQYVLRGNNLNDKTLLIPVLLDSLQTSNESQRLDLKVVYQHISICNGLQDDMPYYANVHDCFNSSKCDLLSWHGQ